MGGVVHEQELHHSSARGREYHVGQTGPMHAHHHLGPAEELDGGGDGMIAPSEYHHLLVGVGTLKGGDNFCLIGDLK